MIKKCCRAIFGNTKNCPPTFFNQIFLPQKQNGCTEKHEKIWKSIHEEIYILIQTESREVWQNPFPERRSAYTKYTFTLNPVHQTNKISILRIVFSLLSPKLRPLKKKTAKNIKKHNTLEAGSFSPLGHRCHFFLPIFSSSPWGSALCVFINQRPSNSNIPRLVFSSSPDKLSVQNNVGLACNIIFIAFSFVL